MSTERENRMFWVIDYSGRPKEARGWSCAKTKEDGTGADDYWWFPSVGFSTSEVFESKAEALPKALAAAKARAAYAKALVCELMETK